MPYRWHWNPRELYEPNPLPFITGRRNWSPPEMRVAKLRVTLPRFYQRSSETGSVASTRPSPVLRDGAEFICSSGDKTYTLTWYDVACSPINADLIFWALIFLPEGWPLLAASAGSKLDLCLGLRCWCALCYRTLRWHMVYGKRRTRTHSSQVYVWQPALTPNIFFFCCCWFHSRVIRHCSRNAKCLPLSRFKNTFCWALTGPTLLLADLICHKAFLSAG